MYRVLHSCQPSLSSCVHGSRSNNKVLSFCIAPTCKTTQQVLQQQLCAWTNCSSPTYMLCMHAGWNDWSTCFAVGVYTPYIVLMVVCILSSKADLLPLRLTRSGTEPQTQHALSQHKLLHKLYVFGCAHAVWLDSRPLDCTYCNEFQPHATPVTHNATVHCTAERISGKHCRLHEPQSR